MRTARMGTTLALLLAMGWSGGGSGRAEESERMAPHAGPAKHVMVTPRQMKWAAAPPSLPPGARLAVIEGDPRNPGPFTMRVRIPANYKVPPHWHPADEHVTVLSGTLYMGLGDKLDRTKGKALPAGSFSVTPAQTRHFAWTLRPTIIQVHGIGPWGITYVNPKDDPRNK
jgi:quercetin dioxygenase-like cupin family protein